jgi:hypothetical protein
MELVVDNLYTANRLFMLRNLTFELRIEVKTGIPQGGTRVSPNPSGLTRESNEHGTTLGRVGFLPNHTYVMNVGNIRTLKALKWAVGMFPRLNSMYANNTGSRYMIAVSFNASVVGLIQGMLSNNDAATITFRDGTDTITRDFETNIEGVRLILTRTAKSAQLFQFKRHLEILRANQQMPALLRDIRIATIQTRLDALRVEMSHGYYPAPSAAQVVARQNQARANDQRRVAEALARHATPDNNNDPNVPECTLCREEIRDERPIQFKNGDTDQVYHAKCAFQATIERRVQKYPYQQTRMSRRNIDQVLESPALRQWQTSRATRTSAGASSSSTPPA